MIYTQIKLRRAKSSDWLEENPVLASGEPGFEKDTRRIKIGNGVNAWADLDYITVDIEPGEIDDATILAHINSELPHPIYDDGPSLSLLYENAKV